MYLKITWKLVETLRHVLDLTTAELLPSRSLVLFLFFENESQKAWDHLRGSKQISKAWMLFSKDIICLLCFSRLPPDSDCSYTRMAWSRAASCPPRSLWQHPLVWITEHDNIVRWETGKVTAHYSRLSLTRWWSFQEMLRNNHPVFFCFFLLLCQTSFSETNTIYCVNSRWLDVKRI